MDAAIAALIGAGIGATVPAGTSVVLHLTSARADRAARVFDHQREAYTTFIATYREFLDKAWTYWNESDQGKAGVEPEHDVLAPLYDMLTTTALYSSKAAQTQARASFDVLNDYVHGTNHHPLGSHSQYEAAENALRAFVDQTRSDLGVPD